MLKAQSSLVATLARPHVVQAAVRGPHRSADCEEEVARQQCAKPPGARQHMLLQLCILLKAILPVDSLGCLQFKCLISHWHRHWEGLFKAVFPVMKGPVSDELVKHSRDILTRWL